MHNFGILSKPTHQLNPSSYLKLIVLYSVDSNKQAQEIEQESGPSCKFVAETKLNNNVYFVYTLSAVGTVQLINNWRQDGLSRGFVDYSENGEQTDSQIHRYTGVVIESAPV